LRNWEHVDAVGHRQVLKNVSFFAKKRIIFAKPIDEATDK